MSSTEVFEKITEIFRDLFDEYEGPVTPDLTADKVEQWDSLGHVQFIVMIEQAFKIRLKPNEIEELKNLNSLITLVTNKIG